MVEGWFPIRTRGSNPNPNQSRAAYKGAASDVGGRLQVAVVLVMLRTRGQPKTPKPPRKLRKCHKSQEVSQGKKKQQMLLCCCWFSHPEQMAFQGGNLYMEPTRKLLVNINHHNVVCTNMILIKQITDHTVDGRNPAAPSNHPGESLNGTT